VDDGSVRREAGFGRLPSDSPFGKQHGLGKSSKNGGLTWSSAVPGKGGAVFRIIGARDSRRAVMEQISVAEHIFKLKRATMIVVWIDTFPVTS